MNKWILTSYSLCFLLLSACFGGDEEVKTQPDEQSQVEETDAKQEERENIRQEELETSNEDDDEQVYEEMHPLTGERTKEVSPYRPIAVMLNNHPAARPQSSLSKADIVYEVLTEGDVTRLLAIYQSEQPEKIGPVRSARGYFIDLAQGYDSFFVTHGWSPEAEQILQNGTAPFLNGLFHDGTLFQRSRDRQPPHNSYITFDNILKGLGNKGYELEKEVEPNTFEEKGISSFEGQEAKEIEVWYRDKYSVQFEYNEREEAYERSSDHEPTLDEKESARVSPENVLIIEAPHQVVDDKGRRQINFEAGGKGLLLQKGELLQIKWKNEDGRILPEKEGEDIAFVPGQTWINVVPTASALDDIVNDLHD
ncbi:DUF3048 domain-containing protein [Alteribacillus sp. YIM 98480]|uniref:DUF3048 domain-containing protein n=1 Tax=Alteribacillus sp. YIM 98480 TaxID=2606599 RepID=UPI00131AEF71|nr:DUF3048 domain-containing protein [Alteribacillus sp. YIM 98480]